jgi:hypothetical protein
VKPCVFVGPLQIVETLGVRLESSSWFISQFHASPPGLLGPIPAWVAGPVSFAFLCLL